MEVAFDAHQFLEFGLGSFGALCKISILQLLKLCFTNLHPISSKLYTGYPNHGTIQAITFLGICQKVLKNKAFWIFS